MSTVKFTGKSEEDAVRKAARELNLKPAEVHYKIVSQTGGLLGLLGQVVTIEVPLGDDKRKSAQPAPKPEKPKAPKAEKPKAEKAKAEKAPSPPPLPKAEAPAEEPEAPVAEAESVAQEEAPAKSGGRGRSRGGRGRGRNRRRDEGPRERSNGGAADDDDEAMAQEVDETVMAEKVEKAQTLLSEMVLRMESQAEVKAAQKEAEIHVAIVGDLPDWMGRGHNRNIEALQFIANKIINRFPPRYRVVLLPEGKRDERLETLEKATLELATKVKETGETIWLVPMSPKERRIVHLAVATVQGLRTESFGYGSSRRLCIMPEKSAE